MKKSIFHVLITVLLCFLAVLVPFSAHAAESDAQSKGVLTIIFHRQEESISGVNFKIYRFAERSADGSFALTGSFSAYPVSLENFDNDALVTLADNLFTYVSRDKIASDAQGETTASGTLRFDNLDTGIYLVLGESFTRGNKIYTPQPFVVFIPYVDSNGNTEYDITTEPKYNIKDMPDDTTEPTTIPEPPSETTTAPEKPNETTTAVPSEPSLPQTGQLWWPVPLLIAAGFLLFILGIAVRYRSEDSNA